MSRSRGRGRRILRAACVALALGAAALAWWLRPYPPGPTRPIVVSTLPGPRPAKAIVVYASDFDAPPGATFAGWSSSPITYQNRFGLPISGTLDAPRVTNVEAPKSGRRFLGEFGGPRLDPTARTRVRQAVRLRLDDLPPHSEILVELDLLILKSWDGDSPRYGPDRWSLKIDGESTPLDATFSNNPKVEADGSTQGYPVPVSPPHAGSAAAGTLGYTFFGDSVYRLKFVVPHTRNSVIFEFTGDLFEGKGEADESWGLDNIAVGVIPG